EASCRKAMRSPRSVPVSGRSTGSRPNWRIAARASSARFGHRRESTGRLLRAPAAPVSLVEPPYPTPRTPSHAPRRSAPSESAPRRRKRRSCILLTATPTACRYGSVSYRCGEEKAMTTAAATEKADQPEGLDPAFVRQALILLTGVLAVVL